MNAALTQAELSKRSGVRQATISDIESGATVPSGRSLYKLAKALGIQPGAIELNVHDVSAA